ncbi:uncharacterized protein YhaN [Bacillus mesophilus]|uniref:AAA family ATPase n=1 Tax=Bacillus mesophilus TaxID=1808955 RepID=A0A6M0Q373_9BACI|nr:AAA family ATPase [Bacillus mesophilus]MBM7659935.1 uncharacterized protein YhaN [Bacillus mesophilus]NEY70796.1 AAA family ATPase [Bacillus mesophilus]
MIIQKLHIYGYGKMVDQEIQLTDSLHAFYGENEAGKSTIMSFMHSILFGFPLRNQHENRYEPRTGLKYGGKMTIYSAQYGQLTIERLAGKAAGEITVYFEDGTVGGEVELHKLLNGMNRKLFTSIFSFCLQGLQDIQSINGDELSQYLLSTSILGSDQIIELEKKLLKEMEQIFKPSGKKPELNQDLDLTAKLAQQVHSAKSQVLEYQTLLSEEAQLEADYIDIQNELHNLGLLIKKLDIFEQYIPFNNERISISVQREELGLKPVIPVNGITRLENLLQNLLPIEARISGLKVKFEENQKKLKSLSIDEELINRESEVKAIVQKDARVIMKQESLLNIASKIEMLEDQAAKIKKTLGVNLTDLELDEINLSLSVKNDLKELLSKYMALQNKKEILQQQQEQIQENIVTAENGVRHYRVQLLSAEKREELTSVVNMKANEQILKNSLHSSKSRYERVKKQISGQERLIKNANSIKYSFLLPFSIFLIVYGIWQTISEQMVAGILFLLSGMMVWFGGSILSKKLINTESLLLLKEELRELEEELRESGDDDSNSSNWIEAEQLLAKDEQIQLALHKDNLRLQQLEMEYETTIQKFEKWEQSLFIITSQLDQLKTNLKIPEQYSYSMLLEFYDQLERLVSLMEESQKHIDEKSQLENEIFEHKNCFEQLLQGLGRSIAFNTITPQQLIEELEEANRKKRVRDIIEEHQKELVESLRQIENEANYYKCQITILYTSANVDTEEEFREKAILNEKWNELETRMQRINENTMILLQNNEEWLQEFTDQTDLLFEHLEQKETLNAKYEATLQQEKELLSKFASIKLQKKQIEQAGVYSSLLQQLEVKKAQLQDKAKTWAKLAIAKDVLQQTKDYYRVVRLPQVLEKAEQFFQTFTKRGYSRLFLEAETHAIMVERRDGMRFSPNELSQATSEQLYLSMRLALATYYQSLITFPIIIDDSFVNFDQSRYEITMEVLKQLSKERQIIFFTCHQQALEGLNLKPYGLTNLHEQLANKAY